LMVCGVGDTGGVKIKVPKHGSDTFDLCSCHEDTVYWLQTSLI